MKNLSSNKKYGTPSVNRSKHKSKGIVSGSSSVKKYSSKLSKIGGSFESSNKVAKKSVG